MAVSGPGNLRVESWAQKAAACTANELEPRGGRGHRSRMNHRAPFSNDSAREAHHPGEAPSLAFLRACSTPFRPKPLQRGFSRSPRSRLRPPWPRQGIPPFLPALAVWVSPCAIPKRPGRVVRSAQLVRPSTFSARSTQQTMLITGDLVQMDG